MPSTTQILPGPITAVLESSSDEQEKYRVLHVLDHSMPLLSGYSVRSHSLITAQKHIGLSGVDGSGHLLDSPHRFFSWALEKSIDQENQGQDRGTATEGDQAGSIATINPNDKSDNRHKHEKQIKCNWWVAQESGHDDTSPSPIPSPQGEGMGVKANYFTP